jgi:hypothetical protein
MCQGGGFETLLAITMYSDICKQGEQLATEIQWSEPGCAPWAADLWDEEP